MRVCSAVIACLFTAAILAGLAGCSDSGDKESGRGEHPLIRGVTLEKAALAAIPERYAATGTVRAKNMATLSARVAGTISGIHVSEGDHVRRGQLLLTLDAPESSAGAAGADYAVEEAQRAVDEAAAHHKLAAVTFDRYAQLYREQAATRQEFDTRQAENDMARQSLARAKARLAQVRESARTARTISGYTRITAPASGIVTGKPVDMGATVFPGMLLMTLEELGSYRLEVAMPESFLGKVKLDQTVPVALDGAAIQGSGTVVAIVPRVEPASRTFLVKLAIDAKGVRSGAFGRALFPVGEKKVILIPKAALVERGGLTSVWAVDRQNIARMRLVKPGSTFENRIEILAGLVDGEQVVTGGVEKVIDGARVE
jgi:membrane fusion protein, multidrug efflux system